MEHIAAFMMLVGCGAGAQDCREIAVPVPAYEDVAECTQELRLQMRLNEATAAKIYGTCKDVDEDTFDRATSVDWSVTKDGRLLVRFDSEQQVMAAR
ncbi:hypothetical protein [Aureimonas leprariae]|uniref:Uncharacterized protein n=1 Tax=Plantimonas leprariae TaxID=2615207 RepID=A0A7V7TZX7_9HYPH|nr:hypothetical protein [Aureimonas leprariae]KAB0679866.1 hypothetical protein F6X38_11620 [Aureimonas leprariae]